MHTHVVINDLYLRVFILDRRSLIKLPDNRHQLWNNLLQILHRPLLKRFCKNGVVCVCAGSAHHINCLVHIEPFLFCQNTNQFRNDHCRMGIVDLDHCMVIHLVKIVAIVLHLF